MQINGNEYVAYAFHTYSKRCVFFIIYFLSINETIFINVHVLPSQPDATI